MKICIVFIFLSTFSFAQQIEVTSPKYTIPDSITIADGTKISREELTRRCNMAWDNSFGKLTKEENNLLFSVPIKISIEAVGEGEQPVESIIEPKKTTITPHPPNG